MVVVYFWSLPFARLPAGTHRAELPIPALEAYSHFVVDSQLQGGEISYYDQLPAGEYWELSGAPYQTYFEETDRGYFAFCFTARREDAAVTRYFATLR